MTGSAAGLALPRTGRVQQGERVRRIGVLMAAAADDPEYRSRAAALTEALQQLGWRDGRNVRFDTRWASGDDVRRHATHLARADQVIE
jgi:hypothetical protein